MTPLYGGQMGTGLGNQNYPGQSGTVQPTQNGMTARRGVTGMVQTIALYENGLYFVGNGIVDNRAGYGTMNNGISGITVPAPVTVTGLKPGSSQLAYTSDGTNMIVSQYEENSLMVIPPLTNGGNYQPYPITGVGTRPSELATTNSEYGELVAVVTDEGVTVIPFTRMSYGGPSVYDGGDRLDYNLKTGKPTSVAFIRQNVDVDGKSESRTFLAVGVADTYGSNSTGGRIDLCDIAVLRGVRRSTAYETQVEWSSRVPMGCKTIEMETENPYNVTRAQRFMGTSTKLAVNQFLAVSLSSDFGIFPIDTHGLLNDYMERRFANGDYISRRQYDTQGSTPIGGKFVDVALHPSGNVMALNSSSVVTYNMDNELTVGQAQAIPVADRATAMSVDPNGKYLLVADGARGRVAIARLNGRGVAPNSIGFVDLHACPMDVAIRSARSFRPSAPVAASSEE